MTGPGTSVGLHLGDRTAGCDSTQLTALEAPASAFAVPHHQCSIVSHIRKEGAAPASSSAGSLPAAYLIVSTWVCGYPPATRKAENVCAWLSAWGGEEQNAPNVEGF